MKNQIYVDFSPLKHADCSSRFIPHLNDNTRRYKSGIRLLCLFHHRMIPPSSKNFLVNNLAAGTQYDLCVLAIYDDVITSLTATRVVGCVQFTTESEYMRCHFMQSQVLGGTMIIIIGGIIVASVLVFIIILMIRYKVGSPESQVHGVFCSLRVFMKTQLFRGKR